MASEYDFEYPSTYEAESKGYGELNALTGLVMVETAVPVVETIMNELGASQASLGELDGLVDRGINFASSLAPVVAIFSLMWAGFKRIMNWKDE